MGFKQGQTVTNGLGERWTIIAVELEDAPFLGATLDTGRYTIKTEDGRVLHNTPGYLMRKES